MAIESVGRVMESQGADQQASVELDEFMEIFITQLNYQDPLDPVDNREFLTQLAEFSNLELARATEAGITELLEVNAVSQSLSLLGKLVEVNGENGTTIGNVESIRFEQGVPYISLSTSDGILIPDLSLNDIRIVKE
ncbi:flagellar hook assembly protein FlgD [Microbulbifer sp. ANSA003]|uniref:flagellar hook assembly protein FlgD n=1 Tax=unclassified Microbulbifer TaxID=2619833 RepID=UPI00403B071C